MTVGAISAFDLAACSTPDSGGTSADGSPVEISYLHRLPDGDGMTPVKDIVARWNDENPDIQVKATKLDGAASA